MSNPIISIQNLSKSFHVGTGDVQVLKNLSFEIEAGDYLIIFGPSGCGKSTLLHTMLGLEEPTSGKIIFLGKNLYDGVIEDERSDFRKVHIGMIYQQPNWIKSLNVLENIAFPLLLLGQDRNTSLVKATVVLETVEMTAWGKYIPTELSSGQQQRIALARALVTNPEVIIADEPTGNMDYESGQKLMQILSYLNISKNKTIVMVTHDLEYLRFAKRAIRMFNGTIVGIYSETEKGNLIDEIKSKRGNEVLDSIATSKIDLKVEDKE
jgi:ABC-type lipoprotein export system ATPase subunit